MIQHKGSTITQSPIRTFNHMRKPGWPHSPDIFPVQSQDSQQWLLIKWMRGWVNEQMRKRTNVSIVCVTGNQNMSQRSHVYLCVLFWGGGGACWESRADDSLTPWGNSFASGRFPQTVCFWGLLPSPNHYPRNSVPFCSYPNIFKERLLQHSPPDSMSLHPPSFAQSCPSSLLWLPIL